MERATQADHAVVGIGTWTPEGSSILPILPQELAEATADAGAVAVVSGRVLDAEGRPLDVGVDERIVGLTLGQLRSIPTIIGTCFGAHRADAVRAAVRAGVIDVLVVDEPLGLRPRPALSALRTSVSRPPPPGRSRSRRRRRPPRG